MRVASTCKRRGSNEELPVGRILSGKTVEKEILILYPSLSAIKSRKGQSITRFTPSIADH